MATHRLGGSSKRKSKREGLISFFKGQNLSRKVRQLNLSSRQEVERGVGGDTRNLSVGGVQ